ncbi:hypothetical protein ISE1_1661 [plant metagenome]|uniref:Uncharacterized protein n=1 Tax=plant metagenome TaxID=1297885 RepID=A0A484P9J3_9ZZZZ
MGARAAKEGRLGKRDGWRTKLSFNLGGPSAWAGAAGCL